MPVGQLRRNPLHVHPNKVQVHLDTDITTCWGQGLRMKRDFKNVSWVFPSSILKETPRTLMFQVQIGYFHNLQGDFFNWDSPANVSTPLPPP